MRDPLWDHAAELLEWMRDPLWDHAADPHSSAERCGPAGSRFSSGIITALPGIYHGAIQWAPEFRHISMMGSISSRWLRRFERALRKERGVGTTNPGFA